jgi:pimeloyl-ACP methyl ester carboxylesterase
VTDDFVTAHATLTLRCGRVELIQIEPPRADPDAPTLLFLHEGLGSAGLWRDFPGALVARTGCPAVLYSRYGYGASDAVALPRPLDYMHREALDVLPELVERAGIGEHVLIGHSDGASIALIYAARGAAAGLRGVISEAAHVHCEPVTVAAIERAKADYLSGRLRAALERHHGANVDVAFFGWCDAWLDPDFRAWDIRAELASIRVPVLALQGDDDPYGTAQQLDAIRQRIGTAAQIRLVQRCGHAPHRDQPALVLDAMASFVERCRTAPPRGTRDSDAK